ncbi:MAG: universal stress protein [Nannocystaceae bacterium]
MAWRRIKSSVLVPVENESGAALSLEVARSFVEHPAEIHMLTVVVPPSSVSPGVIWGTVDVNTVLSATEAFLREIACTHGFSEANIHVRLGTAGPEIARFAAEEAIELIVLPSRGRRGFDRFVLGSTAEQVVRRAKCEVFVIHPEHGPD